MSEKRLRATDEEQPSTSGPPTEGSTMIFATLRQRAPTRDDTLYLNDVGDLLEELLPAGNHSFELGLRLGLLPHIVESIHSAHTNPQSRLLHIIVWCLKNTFPILPTWRTFLDALRSPEVNLPELANKVEAAHYPDPTATQDVIPDATAIYETLSPDDLFDVMDELSPAGHKSYELGLKFQVPYATLEYIHSCYSDRSSRFISVIREFLDKGLNPTWRIIIDALRSPIVNLPLLANVVEAAHFPELTSNQPETRPTVLQGEKFEVTCQTPLRDEDDHSFVEQPSDDFFCPVTAGLLLQPHLTSCCGKHLSQEAATRIQGDGKACPLCNTPKWSTVVNKHFQRQVNALRVLCRHEDRGCGWQGGLSDLKRHLRSCPMRYMYVPRRTYPAEESTQLFAGKTFVYTGKQTDFFWDEAGISLHFPATSCEKDVKISIAVVDIEEAILPLHYRFMPAASATYRITASGPLPAPVKVLIHHCAVLEGEDSLVHIVAHKGPPYRFQILPGGKFPPGSSYGEIELMNFSFLRIVWKILGYKMWLALHVFYFDDSRAIFVVTKNTAENNTAVTHKYRKAIRVTELTMAYDYTTDKIALSLPPPTVHGWSVKSIRTPAEIDMDTIKHYVPGRIPPSIELRMKWEGSGEPIEDVEVGITGGDIKSFTLFCTRTPAVSAAANVPETGQARPPPMLPPTTAVQEPPLVLSRSDTPTLPLLQSMSTGSGNSIKIIQEIGAKYRSLGTFLLNDDKGAITGEIIEAHHHQPLSITYEILSRWLQGSGRDPKTWDTLITVLRDVQLSQLAQTIDENLSA